MTGLHSIHARASDRVCFILIATAAACTGGERSSTGQCPAGETCSARTPHGLHFLGNDVVGAVSSVLVGPAPTAIGGTQIVQLAYAPNGGDLLIALDLPYVTDDEGGSGIKVESTAAALVTVRGAGSRQNYLRILDPHDLSLYDRKQLAGAAVDAIALVATDGETIPAGMPLAWATGEQTVGIALTGAVQESSGPIEERLVDTSMHVALAGASTTRPTWDTVRLSGTAAGSYPLAVTAGDRPASELAVVVVDRADAMTAIAPPTTVGATGTTACFAATRAGRFVVGLDWTFVVDGTTYTRGAADLGRNCIAVTTTKTTGTVAVQASAGGQSATLSLAVVAHAVRAAEPGAPGATRTTAGDRAASALAPAI